MNFTSINSRVQGISWRADSCTAGQKIPCLYGARVFITMFTKPEMRHYLELVKSSSHPHTLCLQDIFNIIFNLPGCLFISCPTITILYAYPMSPYVQHVQPIPSSTESP